MRTELKAKLKEQYELFSSTLRGSEMEVDPVTGPDEALMEVDDELSKLSTPPQRSDV